MQFSDRAKGFGSWTAVFSNGKNWSYKDLLSISEQIAFRILDGQSDLNEKPVAFMAAPGFHYVAIQWGIWRAGGIAVPLSLVHPDPELEYVISTVGATRIIVDNASEASMRELAKRLECTLINAESKTEIGSGQLPGIDSNRKAMILFTSGTTSRPKGVVTTHANIRAQVSGLSEAWDWEENDHILSVLPLHHTHGIINVVGCAMWNGAICEFLNDFNPIKVWNAFEHSGANLFMAVPTIYKKLIDAFRAASVEQKERWSSSCRKFRLMVSGSAALPVSVLEEWEEISGHRLLERYGMTEIGMALSNPLKGERRPGHVGLPLPGVEIRLVNEKDEPVGEGNEGGIQIKGPSVFFEYWNREQDTKAAFTQEGWFRTGDVAVLNEGYYRILGRSSVDIIKSGGYKISALEIEEVLRQYPGIKDCAVVGVEDEEWGERVSAAYVAEADSGLIEKNIQEWLAERIAPYKVPRNWKPMENLPRNALGKVLKPKIKSIFAQLKD